MSEHERTGYVDPLAVIGHPPEHRDYRWRSLVEPELVFHEPIVHPSAIVEAFASIDAGLERPTTICSGVYVMKHAHVGHDSLVLPLVNLAPHVVIGGHCVIGSRSKVGIGAVIRPRTHVGHGCVIGAGAVVVDDVPAGETWVGNPARPIVRRVAAANRDGLQTLHGSAPDTWAGSEAEYELWLEAFGPRYRP